ncbi:MAG TPA: FG-GAP-like repeat-containing protein [Anaerolineae bacterium]|nr:FG-GAP-like repeat-containing protein [Anaerolineae bacterium]
MNQKPYRELPRWGALFLISIFFFAVVAVAVGLSSPLLAGMDDMVVLAKGEKVVVPVDAEPVATDLLGLSRFGRELVYIGDRSYVTYDLDFGDWDGDGDLDVAVANDNGPVEVYENVDGFFQLDPANGLGWQSSAPYAPSRGVMWGDWDGDGDLDLAVANRDVENWVYENVGGDLVLAWSSPNAVASEHVAWGDWDGDGDLDLAVANYDIVNNEDEVYENVGGDLVLAWLSPAKMRTNHVAWGDYDNDGDLDLATANLGAEANLVYENTGGNLELNVGAGIGWEQPDGERGSTFKVEWVDYDNDGDLDLTFGNMHRSQIYLNTGTTFSLTWTADVNQRARGFAWGDWDGDGDLDLAGGGDATTDPNWIYENDGLGSIQLDPANGWGWEEFNPAAIFDIEWVDYDGDGDLDLAFATDIKSVIYINDKGLLVDTGEYPLLVNPGTFTEWGDYDGDGDLDLAVADFYFESENYVYENVDSQLILNVAAGFGWQADQSWTTTDVEWVDWDGDGDLDLSFTNEDSFDEVYENDGTTLVLSPTIGLGWTSDVISPSVGMSWGDWDGDGDLDLAVGYDREKNRIYENIGGDLVFDPAQGLGWEAPISERTTAVDFGDWDGDGDLDLAVGNRENSRVYENVGGELLNGNGWGWIDPNPFWVRDVRWGDWDGDGDLDLAMIAGVAVVYENVGRDFKLSTDEGFGWISPERFISSRIVWGDMEGDGDLDLLVGNQGAPTNYAYVYENIGGDFLGQALPIVGEHGSWGDIDGDGDLDLGLAVGFGDTMILINRFRDNQGLVNNAPRITVDYPVNGQEATSGGSAVILTDSVIPITYTLSDPEYQPAGRVAMFYSLNGGGEWLPAVAATGTLTTNVPTVAAPVANNDILTTSMDVPLTVAAPGLLANDVGNQTVLVTPPTVGDVDLAVDGSLVYTPAVGYVGTDTFSYRAYNSIYPSEPATVTMMIISNTAPVGQTDVYTAYNSLTLSISVPGVLGNDEDGEGNVLSAVVVTPPLTGSLNLASDGSFTYASPVSYTGITTFTYQAYDGALYSPPLIVTLNVTDVIPAGIFGCNVPAADFETGLPATWSPVVYTGPVVWSTTDDGASCGVPNVTPGSGEAACADADWLNEVAQPYNTGLVTNLFDLMGQSGATLQFNYAFEELGVSALDVDIYSAGSWQNLWQINTTAVGTQTLDLGPYLGQTDLQIRFRFSGDDWDWYAQVDNVALSCTGSLAEGPGSANEVVADAEAEAVTNNQALLPATHVFYWDTFASGFFGQSDDVRVRFEVYAQDNSQPMSGTYQYPNLTPSSALWPYATTASSPFRARGTQIRVFGGAEANTPIPNALVYRLPAGQASDGQLLVDNAGKPLTTDNQGYLQGQAQLAVGDQLMAMVPITATDAYTLYFTSGTPITTGLALDTVDAPGTQTLIVSATKPLLLFNIDVSLEWDATNDNLFLETLATVIGYSSDVLYDVSNGQAALGKVRLYQNRENWHEADILMYAANDIHPSATMGGIVTTPTHDIGLTGVITNAYRPGVIRMGSNWDPFGESQADFTQDWWQVLTHELGHYLFFMPDNYIGSDETGMLATDCIGSFMTTSYDDAYTEFLPQADWVGDCLLTLAAQTTGRPDWETITTFYPMLNAPASRFENSGPSLLPLSVIDVDIITPASSGMVQAGRNYTLRDAGTGQVVTAAQARGYLRQTNNTADLTDDAIIPLGVTNAGGDRLKVRGAKAGDEVCIVDISQNPAYLGCETVDSLSSSIDVYSVADWQPNILVKSITSETLAITVTQYVSPAQMNVQVLPAYGLPGVANVITSTWGALSVVDPSNPVTFTGQIHLDYLTFEGTVRVWVPGTVPGTVPTWQGFTDFAISLDAWGGESAVWGGESAVWSGESAIWGGESAIWGGESAVWGGPSRPWGAPSVSTDGQLIILNFDDPYGPTGIGSMQSLASLSTLPSWLTLVGDAYNVQLRPGFSRSVTRTVAIDYLQRQVPDGYENTLTMYHSPDDGKTWRRLPTNLDVEENRAVAFMDSSQPQGIYALIATIRMSPFTVGWNLFGYPVNETRPISIALASIDGAYNSVYHYNAYTAQWLLYDTPVVKDYPSYAGLVNDLDDLQFGFGYWLYATEPITLFLGVPIDSSNSLMDTSASLFSFPPMTLFGPVTGTPTFTPTAGMAIDAYIDGVLCGTGNIVDWNSQLAYKLQVKANSGDGCGTNGVTVTFRLDGELMIGNEFSWDSSQAQYHPLVADICATPATPMVTYGFTGADLLLSWLDAGADQYEIWHHTAPYEPLGADCGAAGNCSLETDLSYTDTGVITAGALNVYQTVAVQSCGVRSEVVEDGLFTFGMVPGQ